MRSALIPLASVRWLAPCWAAIIALAACGPATVPPPPLAQPGAPRLSPPPPIDPSARGAAYLNALALQLQPGWHQFLDDCRLRLPASHPLNTMTLAATAELVIDSSGKVTVAGLTSSGVPDYDRAVRDAIADATPLPKPPVELWSDDDHGHVRWLFARDRRQAGPATAAVIDFELPIVDVIERLVARADFTRAAQRVLRAPSGADREAATKRLMIAALRQGLASSESAVRRTSLEAVDLLRIDELEREAAKLFASATDPDIRLAAIEFAPDATVVEELRRALKENAPLALQAALVLARRDRAAAAATVIVAELDAKATAPNPVALKALSIAPVAELAPSLVTWFTKGDARTRAGVCAALAGFSPDVAWPLLSKGARDRDATVRTTCLEAARSHRDPPTQRTAIAAKAATLVRLRELVRDRDRAVRARALIATGVLDRGQLGDASDDPAAEVRAAYAIALANAHPPDVDAKLRPLLDDRDADVRASAWTAYVVASTNASERRPLAVRAATDSAPHVRRAAIGALEDEEQLKILATTDVAPEVRTAAYVRLAQIKRRNGIDDMVMTRFAAAPPGGLERVRTAMAWLLAR